MHDVTVRHATLDDAATLAVLAGQLGYPSTETDLRARLTQVFASPADAVLVEMTDERIVGWIHVAEVVSVESEMFAEIRVDLADRGTQSNQTDVVQLNADLLDVTERGDEYLASVRFSGLIRETPGVAAEPFAEIWNLSKSRLTGEGWLLAGIQQTESH